MADLFCLYSPNAGITGAPHYSLVLGLCGVSDGKQASRMSGKHSTSRATCQAWDICDFSTLGYFSACCSGTGLIWLLVLLLALAAVELRVRGSQFPHPGD